MSNLKFRAWSVQNKQMYYATPFRGYITSNGRWWGLYNGDDVKVASSEYDDKLMQYTGVKDKNGIEIYEGDIVRYDETVYVVEFINQSYEPLCYYYNTRVEVIGNIYEHPELIKESKNEV